MAPQVPADVVDYNTFDDNLQLLGQKLDFLGQRWARFLAEWQMR